MEIKLASDNATILWADGDHRGSIAPTHDLTGYALEIQDFAATVWTVAFIDAWRLEHYPPLTIEQLRAVKLKALESEGVRRANLIMPAIRDFFELQLVREQYLSVAVASRTPTVSFQKLIDIYVAGENAYLWIMDPARTYQELLDADAVTGPAWPV